ncbi:MAG: N-acetyltransferase [Bacteroidetes bacterium]|nr:N-acetyltransferase [Bacteroidota bacterium]
MTFTHSSIHPFTHSFLHSFIPAGPSFHHSSVLSHFHPLLPSSTVSSYIASTASIGRGSKIGQFCVIEDDVVIGDGCEIGHHVVLHRGTNVGSNVRIDDHATIGKQPMRAPNSAVTQDKLQPPAVIGPDCLLGASVVVYAGALLGRKVLVADLATIREDVSVGDFTIVGRGVAIENKCAIGRYCKLETNVYVTAYSTIEDRVFVAPGVLTSNDNFMGRTEERFKHFRGVTVKRGGRIGVGAVILPGKEIAPDAVVAAGALLTRDADPDTIYAGVPARSFRDVPEEQKLKNQGWKDD